MAVIKVAKTGNPEGRPYLYKLVTYPDIIPGGNEPATDPVDSLQSLYDEWKRKTNNSDDIQKQDYDFCLYQNYPNPFNPSTAIHFSLARPQRVSLKVYDLLGNEVASLIHNERKEAGDYSTEFHAVHLVSGVYVYRLQAEDFTETMKMLLIK